MMPRNMASAVEDEGDSPYPRILLLTHDAAALLLEYPPIRRCRLGDALLGERSDVDTIRDASIEDINQHEAKCCRQYRNVRKVQAARQAYERYKDYVAGQVRRPKDRAETDQPADAE